MPTASQLAQVACVLSLPRSTNRQSDGLSFVCLGITGNCLSLLFLLLIHTASPHSDSESDSSAAATKMCMDYKKKMPTYTYVHMNHLFKELLFTTHPFGEHVIFVKHSALVIEKYCWYFTRNSG